LVLFFKKVLLPWDLPLKILSVASELFPLVKTGGLADVAASLAHALAAEGMHVTTLLPGYPSVMAALRNASVAQEIPSLFGGPAHLVHGTADGLDILTIDAPHLYARPGNPYVGPNGEDWPDNAQRFAALGRVAADIGRGAVAAIVPRALHLHDWQAGLAASYLHGNKNRPGIVATVHNLAFQGLFPAALLGPLGIPRTRFGIDGLEYHGNISFLKAALVYADRITTVSPTYAGEIRTPEGGMGLDGVLRARGTAMTGILNGIDIKIWNPATDRLIEANYDAADPAPRAANKAALQRIFGLPQDGKALLCGVVSRLSWQKGLDLLVETLPAMRAANMQLVVLGNGEASLQAAFAAAAHRDPAFVACKFTYDEALAHIMQAGADALLVPSRFEPCGLTQMCALRYGAVPVVARCGGLADTVIDANEAALSLGVATGVQFNPGTAAALEQALLRLAALWQNAPAWRQLQGNGMAMDFSWHRSAAAYAALFRAATQGRK
jgi:starch synthase